MKKLQILALGLSMLSLVTIASPALAAPGWFGFGGNRYHQQSQYNNGYRPGVFNRAEARRHFEYERAHNQNRRGNSWFGQRRSRW